jgi:hypothetical protein
LCLISHIEENGHHFETPPKIHIDNNVIDMNEIIDAIDTLNLNKASHPDTISHVKDLS